MAELGRRHGEVLNRTYERARDLRNRYNERFPRIPGDPNDFMRHCMTSCTIASDSELGPTFGRALGIANEVRGIGIDLNTDMRDLRDRYDRGAWAFQWEDLMHNEAGFDCAKPSCSDPTSTGESSCLRCCERKFGSF